MDNLNNVIAFVQAVSNNTGTSIYVGFLWNDGIPEIVLMNEKKFLTMWLVQPKKPIKWVGTVNQPSEYFYYLHRN